jgi:hypothetical protein
MKCKLAEIRRFSNHLFMRQEVTLAADMARPGNRIAVDRRYPNERRSK